MKNDDLWQALDEARAAHEVDWHWVQGHAGHDVNERADELAREGMAPFLKRRAGSSSGCRRVSHRASEASAAGRSQRPADDRVGADWARFSDRRLRRQGARDLRS